MNPRACRICGGRFGLGTKLDCCSRACCRKEYGWQLRFCRLARQVRTDTQILRHDMRRLELTVHRLFSWLRSTVRIKIRIRVPRRGYAADVHPLAGD